MSQQQPVSYPLTLRGELAEPLSRGLWIVKWLLAIPHYIVLWALSIAGFAVTIAAFFVILFTGKYPRGMFDFSVGVLRWEWRVAFYTYHALGTDKYPPFSLDAMADYPADLSVEYPEKLSHGLVLVKWWLLAIPHYIIISILETITNILVLFAGIVLLFTGKYPKDMFRFIMGMNRWGYRVSAYALLMTDKYPPFSLD